MKTEHSCFTHPTRKALSFCHSCDRYFCSDCLVESKEFYYCKDETCQNELRQEKVRKLSEPKAQANMRIDVTKESVARKIRDGIISFVISAVGVGTLVGNAYMVCNIGYPKGLDNIGLGIMMGSLIFAILPSIPLFILSPLGLGIPLRGRESFIEMNIGLWVYCVVFYSLLIYFLLQYRRKRREKRVLTVKTNSNRPSDNSEYLQA